MLNSVSPHPGPLPWGEGESFAVSHKNLPDYLLVLPYQFKREIINQERDFLKGGGKMIFALPRVEVITKKDL